MTAADQIVRSAKKVLAMEGRPHMTTFAQPEQWGVVRFNHSYPYRVAVIGSAVIPTVIANAFYLPRHLLPQPEREDMAGPQQVPATRLPQLVRRTE